MLKRDTLRDVAAEAGVSLATVDRALNGRAGVSQATLDRVRSAVERLGFRRDPFAVGLAKNREYPFSFVIPRGPQNTFMVDLKNEVEAAGKRIGDQRIILSTQDYQELDDWELTDVLTRIKPEECAGVAVVAVDTYPVREAIDNLIRQGVGVVTLVSDVTPSRRLHCIGHNNVAVGRVAANLIGKFCRRCAGKVALIAGSMTLRDQADRRVGFEQVMSRELLHLEVLPVEEGRDNSEITQEVVRKVLAQHDDIVGLYNLGAGNRGLIKALEESGRNLDLAVVAHELTPHSRRALVSGTFDAIISQDIADEVEYAVQTLKAFADGNPNFTPSPVRIDIFVRDNLP